MDDAPAVTLDVIVTAWFTVPEAFVRRQERAGALGRLAAGLRPGAPKLRCPCAAYVIRHPTAGAILIDTGFHAQAARSPRREFGALMSIPFRALKPAHAPFDAQLRALGVDPASVGRVVMTHLHLDHTSGLRLLPAAQVVCDRREWEAAHARGATAKGYVGHHLEAAAARTDLVEFERDGVPYGGFEQTIDLLGDGTIRLLSTPGHTRGHLSVLVRRDDGAQALLAGDAVYTLRTLREGARPILTEDETAYRRSMTQLQRFAALEPDVPIVPSHDPDAWRELAPPAA
jgi:N-acyl homoserine lactone hydrolase